MNRFEFMRQLEELLSDISPNEKEEALTYYNDYFNDAGEENEQQVIQELESPEQVAAVVKEGLGLPKSSEAKRQFETGKQEEVPTAQMSEKEQENSSSKAKRSKDKNELPTWAIVLIIIGLVLGSPLIFAGAITVLSLIFAVVVTLFSIIVAFGAVALALYIAGISFFSVGFIVSPVNIWLTLSMIGSGLLMGAISILFMVLTVLLVGKAVPALFRGIRALWQKIFHK